MIQCKDSIVILRRSEDRRRICNLSPNRSFAYAQDDKVSLSGIRTQPRGMPGDSRMFAGLRRPRLRPARLKGRNREKTRIRILRRYAPQNDNAGIELSKRTLLILNFELCILNCFVPSPPHSFQRLLFTPAAGYRHRETGVLAEVGSFGECWSSSTYASDAANASHLALASSKTCPVDTNGAHAYGFSVRCVQASAREVAFFLLYIRYGNLNAKNFSHRHSKPLDPLSERLWIPWKRGLRMRVRISFQEIDLMWQI